MPISTKTLRDSIRKQQWTETNQGISTAQTISLANVRKETTISCYAQTTTSELLCTFKTSLWRYDIAPKFSHTTPILWSLQWLKITERIEYKLLSLTYKVLTTTQPSYLHNLITVQPPRGTRSSSLVTLAHPSTSSSLRITDCSF